ncbi:MAG TPA: DUF4105 domain-containing protein, partial [Gemmatimonadaceae bacterium]|nr:DUF4105 domain-containing protein [Gemmatimonadaceae bacterium]
MLRALLIAGVLARAAAAQNEEAHTREAEQSVIALVTIGPGPHLNQRFGHTALLVANRATGQRELYDYGNFVSSRATWRNVLSGRPLAFAYAQDARAEFRRLATAGRSVELQWLALGTAGKLELLRALARDLRHSTREYLYDYRVNNCTTKIRDLIDRAADGALRRAGQKTDSLTFRERARRDAVLGVVADFVAELGNAEVDRPVTMWDAAANRTALATLVDHTQLKSTPFVDSSSVSVPESSPWTSARAPSTRRMLAAGCACALVLVALALFSGRLAVVTVAAASGSAGLALGAAGMLLAIALLGGYSFAESNVNFLLVNP